MAAPAEKCPTCGAAPTRFWIWPTGSGVERRQCMAGHEWSGEVPAQAGEPSEAERIANLEAAVSELLGLLADTHAPGGLPHLVARQRLVDLAAGFETRRPT